MPYGGGQDDRREWRPWGKERAVNILRFLDKRGRVISDEFLEFIPMGLFEVEGWDSSVGVADRSELESDVDGEVVEAQIWEGAPFTCGS